MTISYDHDADVLYITFRQASDAFYLENAQGDVIRMDRSTGEVLSCTVIGFQRRTEEGEQVSIPQVGSAVCIHEPAPTA